MLSGPFSIIEHRQSSEHHTTNEWMFGTTIHRGIAKSSYIAVETDMITTNPFYIVVSYPPP
jgi:hypothetical protein